MSSLKIDPLTWTEVDLAAIRHNAESLVRHIEPARLIAVVKANAYGHGMATVAKAALEGGASSLGVVSLEEGFTLRKEGIKQPIIVLNYLNQNSPREEIELALKEELQLVVWDRQTVELVAGAARSLKRRASLHLKIDTGTCRLGAWPKDSQELIKLISSNDSLELLGILTHFSSSERDDQSITNEQLAKIVDVHKGLDHTIRPQIHAACSAAALINPATRCDLVRSGIALYGLWPSPSTKNHELTSEFALKPALSWKTRILQIKEVPKNHPIGYDQTYFTEKKSLIAVLPVGYADGLDRGLSNKAHFLVKGHKAPIRGNICMNLTMIDVTNVPKVNLDDEVVIIGQQGKEQITADEMANWAQTINYEIVTRINWQLPRKYLS